MKKTLVPLGFSGNSKRSTVITGEPELLEADPLPAEPIKPVEPVVVLAPIEKPADPQPDPALVSEPEEPVDETPALPPPVVDKKRRVSVKSTPVIEPAVVIPTRRHAMMRRR